MNLGQDMVFPRMDDGSTLMDGLTKRELFAALFMAADIVAEGLWDLQIGLNEKSGDRTLATDKFIAENAVIRADALMEVLKDPETPR